MRKTSYFDHHWGSGWPSAAHIESCLADASGRQSFFAKGHDGGSFFAEGLHGTEKLLPKSGRVDASMYMYTLPLHGILLIYATWDGRIQEGRRYHSKGNLNRLREHVYSFHGTSLPVGLFVSYEAGCRALIEFITSEGSLPTNVEWIAGGDLPPDTYPDPPRLGF